MFDGLSDSDVDADVAVCFHVLHVHVTASPAVVGDHVTQTQKRPVLTDVRLHLHVTDSDKLLVSKVGSACELFADEL